MFTVTQRRLDAVRSGGATVYGYVTATYLGSPITTTDELGRSTTHLPLHADGSNEVAVDGTAPGPRRTLTLTLAPSGVLFDALARPGVVLSAFTAIRYPSGAVDVEPQGVFDVDVARMSYGPSGGIQLTAPDRWQRVVNARFLAPRQVGGAGSSARAILAELLTEALPAGTAVSDLSTSTVSVPVQTEDRDRAGLIQAIAKAASVDVFLDRSGGPVLRDVPVLDAAHPVWTVDAAETGVLISADRERSQQKTYNIVVVSGSSTDGSAPFPAQYVWDSDPSSPTFAGSGAGSGSTPPDPATAGPMGQRPTFYSSPLVTTAAQAVAAGETILARVTAQAAQLTLTQVPAPFLDDGDTVLVKLPPADFLAAGASEVHLIDGFTVPLVPHRNPMPLTTRSTRPDDVSDS